MLRPGAVPPRCSRADSAGTINGANQRGLIKEILIPSASRPAPLSAPGAAPETKGGGGGRGAALCWSRTGPASSSALRPRGTKESPERSARPGAERTLSFVRGSARRCSAPEPCGAPLHRTAGTHGQQRLGAAVWGCARRQPQKWGRCWGAARQPRWHPALLAPAPFPELNSNAASLLCPALLEPFPAEGACFGAFAISPHALAFPPRAAHGTGVAALGPCVCIRCVSCEVATALPTSPCLAPVACRVPCSAVLRAHGCRCVTGLGTSPPKGPCAEPPCGLPVALQTPLAQHWSIALLVAGLGDTQR